MCMEKTLKKSLLLTLLLPMMAGCMSSSLLKGTISGYEQNKTVNGKDINARLQSLVELRADSTAALSSILQLEVVDGAYIVRDNDGVYSFDAGGKLMCKYGARGRGKGEYVNLSCFFVKYNGNVCIIDDYRQSVLEYSRNGSFVSEKKAPDGTFAYVGTSVAMPEQDAVLCSFMANPEHADFCALIDGSFKKTSICQSDLKSTRTAEMYGRHPVSVYNGIAKYVKPYDNHIYTHGDESLTSIEIPKDMVSTMSDEEKGDYTYLGLLNAAIKEKFVGFTDIFETDRYMMLGVSSYDYVMIDKDKGRCVHYTYFIPKKVSDLPLVNIMASDNHHLYGVVTSNNAHIDDETKVKNDDFERVVKAMERVRKTDSPVILVYEVARAE